MKLFGASEPMPKVIGPIDAVLTAIVVGLVVFGVVMVYSASAIHAAVRLHDPQFFLVRQTVYATLGLVTLFVAASIDYHRLRVFTYPIFFVCLVLLVVVAFAGRTAGGATRWIEFGPVNVQPAELAKVGVIFWLAYSLAKKRDRLHDFSVGFLPHVLFAGVFMLLCLFQPDFGSALMIGTITFVLLFTAGTRLGYLLGTVALAVPVAVILVVTSEYRMRRITGFLMGLGDRASDATYQVDQSSMAFANGGLFGAGLGDSLQKMLFLPEAHTDFISAIVAEELGFFGTLGLIVAFSVLVVRAGLAAIRAVDDYGTYLAVGIGTFVGLQAFTNLGVAMGLLPTKGLVLPFISYGGSSLVVNCAAIGVLLNVSRPRERPETTTDPEARAKAEGNEKNGSRPKNVALAGGAA